MTFCVSQLGSLQKKKKKVSCSFVTSDNLIIRKNTSARAFNECICWPPVSSSLPRLKITKSVYCKL